MSIDFSSALRAEADNKFKQDLLDALKDLHTKVDALQAALDAQNAKKAKSEAKE